MHLMRENYFLQISYISLTRPKKFGKTIEAHTWLQNGSNDFIMHRSRQKDFLTMIWWIGFLHGTAPPLEKVIAMAHLFEFDAAFIYKPRVLHAHGFCDPKIHFYMRTQHLMYNRHRCITKHLIGIIEKTRVILYSSFFSFGMFNG